MWLQLTEFFCQAHRTSEDTTCVQKIRALVARRQRKEHTESNILSEDDSFGIRGESSSDTNRLA